MSKKVLVPIADGSEELEAVCIIDVFETGRCRCYCGIRRRITGYRFPRCQVGGGSTGGRLYKRHFMTWLLLPGGMPGAEHLRGFNGTGTGSQASVRGGKTVRSNFVPPRQWCFSLTASWLNAALPVIQAGLTIWKTKKQSIPLWWWMGIVSPARDLVLLSNFPLNWWKCSMMSRKQKMWQNPWWWLRN